MKEIEKLRGMLEQQQDCHLERLTAKDNEWRIKFARHADKVGYVAFIQVGFLCMKSRLLVEVQTAD